MKVAVIGTGYVGLVVGAGLSEFGNDVICVDIDERKIENLKKGILPIYEPGLGSLVENNYKGGRLKFSTSISQGVKESSVIFIAVGTPPDEDGSADLKHVRAVAKDIGKNINGYKVIVDKSTVPVGTADEVKEVISAEMSKRGVKYDFDVVSNPEFLKEGNAVGDFMKPDRIVIGAESEKAFSVIRELYKAFVKRTETIIEMDVRSAEMTKYAANCMLATKISFMNEISRICEKVGADVSDVRIGIGSDPRIGYHFLYPGVGYGGSCFPKDVRALISLAENNDYDPQILKAAYRVNESQKSVLADKILAYFDGTVQGKVIAVWGLSFKPKTDDMREAPALSIINILRGKGAKIQAYDPIASDNAKSILGTDNIVYAKNNYDAVEGADALALITEWNLFREPDFDKMKNLMNNPAIFDGRNQYDPQRIKKLGFDYFSIGR